MSRFVNANNPMYAEVGDHPFKTPSVDFMLAVATRQVDAVSDVEVLQEILYRYRAVGRQSESFAVFPTFATRHPALPFDRAPRSVAVPGDPAPTPRPATAGRDSRRRHAPQRDCEGDRHFDLLPHIERVTPDAMV